MTQSPQPEQDRRELGLDEIIREGDIMDYLSNGGQMMRNKPVGGWAGNTVYRLLSFMPEARVFRPAPQPEKRCSCKPVRQNGPIFNPMPADPACPLHGQHTTGMIPRSNADLNADLNDDLIPIQFCAVCEIDHEGITQEPDDEPGFIIYTCHRTGKTFVGQAPEPPAPEAEIHTSIVYPPSLSAPDWRGLCEDARGIVAWALGKAFAMKETRWVKRISEWQEELTSANEAFEKMTGKKP